MQQPRAQGGSFTLQGDIFLNVSGADFSDAQLKDADWKKVRLAGSRFSPGTSAAGDLLKGVGGDQFRVVPDGDDRGRHGVSLGPMKALATPRSEPP